MLSIKENTEIDLQMRKTHNEKLQLNIFSIFEILPRVFRIRNSEDDLLKAIERVLELFETTLDAFDVTKFQQRYLGIIDSWIEYFSPSQLARYCIAVCDLFSMSDN